MTSLREKMRAGGRGLVSASQLICAQLFSILTPIQQRFVSDPARFKVARCTRRQGKTYAIAAYMLLTCLQQPHTPVLYAGLTRDSAKEAVWPILVEMLERFGIKHSPRESALQIDFPNGSKITLFGCDTENARNRLRGRKFALVCFDETGFYSKLDPLIHAVLPMLADLGGTLCLTSSPGELLQGFFYEADQGLRDESVENWSRYYWTMADNPIFQAPAKNPRYLTRGEEELDLICKSQFKGNRDHPGFVREWLGKWVSDHTALVYPVDSRNLLPASYQMKEQEHGIGISFSAWVHGIAVGRYSPHSRKFQLVASGEFEDLSTDKLGRRLQKLNAVYKPSVMVAHLGDYSKDILLELRRRYQLPIVAADKKDVAFHQKVFATDLMNGNIQIPQRLSILDRYGKIVKGEDGEEIPGQANYQPNAALALYRRVYQTHLSSYTPPLSEEERHLKQLQDSVHIEETPWFERIT